MSKSRINRWMKITNLTAVEIAVLAADAAEGYATGRYGSGYEAGNELSESIGTDATDQRTRAWGDFLIDLGEEQARA